MARTPWFRISSIVSLLLCGTSLSASQPSETLLPRTTKGFISTSDVDEVREKFNATDLGAMVADPVMKPFIDDFKRQINRKMEESGDKIGVRWNDLKGVYGGEVSMSLIQPDPKDKNSHATALIVDVTGKQAEVTKLLGKIAMHQAEKKATRSAAKIAGTDVTVYTQRLKAGQKIAEKSYIFLKDDTLVATDHPTVATEIIGRFGGKATDSLAGVVAFQKAIARNDKAAGEMKFHVRWFMEPFGYAEARRAADGGRKKRGTDMLKILQQQGFTAIQGLGGYIFFNTGTEDIRHRTFIYAPAVPRKAGDKNTDKYDLAARMLNFPNAAAGADLLPQKWAMSDVSTYLTFNIKMREAFNYSETLVDAIAGDEGVFEEMWKSLKIDPHGPQVDVYAGLVNHLGERATLLSDVTLPIEVDSERMLVALEVKDTKIVAATVEKAFKHDPAAKRLEHKGQVIWEILNEQSVSNQPTLSIEGAGSEFVALEELDEEEEEQAILPNMAITVFEGHLCIATHVDFLTKLIDQAKTPKNVGDADDFQRIGKALEKLGSDKDSFRFFSRTDKSYRPTYELLKQNKLPEGETMFARLLNAMLGPEEEGAVRKQEIDGQKLPAYELVEKYLGPGGLYAQSEDDGWFLVGCVLSKNAPAGNAPEKAE